MRIKTKITIAFGVLLCIIVMLGYSSVESARIMKKNTANILADNYNSVKYAQLMLSALRLHSVDSLQSKKLFEDNFRLQKANITEKNEDLITYKIESGYDRFIKYPSDQNLLDLSIMLDSLIQINGQAIERKSEIAILSSNRILLVVSIVAGICAIVAFFMLLKIPKILTRSIDKLIEGIFEISNHNYDKRLTFEPHSEFGKVASSFNNMAAELAQYQQSNMSRIISTKKYLEIVINAMEEPIIGLDSERSILFVNQAAVTILNIREEDMIKRSALDLALTNDLLRKLIRGMDNPDKSEPLKIYSDNKESYFDVHYLSLSGETGTVVILSNITKFKELDNAKTNFISVISHELKTPISAILMSVKLLEDNRIGEMNNDQQELAKSIKDNSERLLSISGELLKMTQVETGHLQLNPKITKPIELITYAINATRVLADRFKCNVEIEYPEKIGKLFVDSEKIAWVITNLLSNAIHYSQENSRVIVGACQIDKTIQIYVQDFGKGIDIRYHKTIFDRYFRVPGTKVQGSGLGLAISKEFVEVHGGTISLESELGRGSRFIVTFDVG